MKKQIKNQDDFLSLEILSEMELGKVSGGSDEEQLGLTSKCWGATNGCWGFNLAWLTFGAGVQCQNPQTPPAGGGGGTGGGSGIGASEALSCRP